MIVGKGNTAEIKETIFLIDFPKSLITILLKLEILCFKDLFALSKKREEYFNEKCRSLSKPLESFIKQQLVLFSSISLFLRSSLILI